ncbi:MAG: response regulator [Candidatus Eremiobacterota bacterium]
MVILVLEDDATLRAVLTEELEDEGFEVHAAGSPSAAMLVAEKHRLDMMVTDVRMDEMDGIQCLSRIKTLQPQMRSIVITGYADTDAPGRAIQAMADDYVHKPFTLREFRAAIQRVLGTEKERAYYAGLFQVVHSGLRRLAEMAEDAQAGREVLDQSRDRAFQSFFVAVRSGLVTLTQAQRLWERLEQLEVERTRAGPEGWSALAEGYQAVIDFLATLGQPGGGSEAGASNQVFSRFFRRVRSGELSNEQLKLAALLRRTAPEPNEPSQVTGLRDKIWGA